MRFKNPLALFTDLFSQPCLGKQGDFEPNTVWCLDRLVEVQNHRRWNRSFTSTLSLWGTTH